MAERCPFEEQDCLRLRSEHHRLTDAVERANVNLVYGLVSLPRVEHNEPPRKLFARAGGTLMLVRLSRSPLPETTTIEADHRAMVDELQRRRDLDAEIVQVMRAYIDGPPVPIALRRELLKKLEAIRG